MAAQQQPVVPIYRETESAADVAAQVAALRILLAVAARRDEARGVQE